MRIVCPVRFPNVQWRILTLFFSFKKKSVPIRQWSVSYTLVYPYRSILGVQYQPSGDFIGCLDVIMSGKTVVPEQNTTVDQLRDGNLRDGVDFWLHFWTYVKNCLYLDLTSFGTTGKGGRRNNALYTFWFKLKGLLTSTVTLLSFFTFLKCSLSSIE